MIGATARDVLAVLDSAHEWHTAVKVVKIAAVPAVQCSCGAALIWNPAALGRAGMSMKEAMVALRHVPTEES